MIIYRIKGYLVHHYMASIGAIVPQNATYGPNCHAKCQIDTKEHLLYHVKNNIPSKIKFAQIDILPTRKDFTDDKLRPMFERQIAAKKPIIFLPTSIYEKNDYVNGTPQYKVYMFGVIPCGTKTCVILDRIPVHIDIMVPTGVTARGYDDILRGQLITRDLKYTMMQDVNMFRLHGFQKAPRPYKRIFFNNLQDRKKLIEYIAQLNVINKNNGVALLETASDDSGFADYYFPKTAREYRFATADWNRFDKYEVLTGITTNGVICMRVAINDFHRLTTAQRAEYANLAHPLNKVIAYDPTMTAMWDIETWTAVQNGVVPSPDSDYTITTICSTYYHHHSDDELLSACVCINETNAREGIKVVIECGTEINLLSAHMEVVGRMNPDITGAFNGGMFDWPMYRAKLKRAGLLVKLKSKFGSLPVGKNDTEDSVMRWCFKSAQIKIDAETVHKLDCVANFPGMLDTDVLPVFLKMYPRAEVRKSASLNFFLAKNKLESKEDMPYKKMFKIYERSCKLMNIKSCHCGVAQTLCGCCKEIIPMIDCVPVDPKAIDIEYTTTLHPDLLRPKTNVSTLDSEGEVVTCNVTTIRADERSESCCFCGKKPRNLQDMADVGYYCVVDCVRPQQLYVKRTIIPDKRELSNMSYVSLHDSFYRADGMKVCNLIGAYCHKRGVAFSNARVNKTKSDKDHYPGAWVFPPNRGLHSDGYIDVEITLPDGTKQIQRKRCRPITGLDFNSLYPSLMMTYNISPDMVVYVLEDALKLAAEGYTIHHIKPFKFERGEEKGKAENKHLVTEGWTVRHNGVFTPKQTTTHAKYVKTVCASFKVDGVDKTLKYPYKDGPSDEQKAVLADITPQTKITYEPELGRERLPGEQMGIFPFIVKKLFDKRVPIKAEFVRLTKLVEHMDLKKVKSCEVNGVTFAYKDIVFKLNIIDAKQKALKVLANTFYGKSGDYSAAIYELLVAAGITCAGQENIKKVAEFVTNKGFTVQYGDSVTGDTPILCRTDSFLGYKTIEELGTKWCRYGDKEESTCNAEVWSDQGWTKINRVIRHYTDKTIYRVITHTGCVDVTSDHSLLDVNANKIKPTDVIQGTELLHKQLPKPSCDGYLSTTEGITKLVMSECRKRYGDDKLSQANFYQLCCDNNIQPIIDYNGNVGIDTIVDTSRCNVQNIINLGSTEQYVYDLETANHHFSAGIGELVVHNTDSCYISCPDDIYTDCDKEYADRMTVVNNEFMDIAKVPDPVTQQEIAFKKARTDARIAWWTKQVDITMELMKSLKIEVSDFLLADNHTCFLNMAYEEVGYPTVLCGKKKYFMTPHVEQINFYPKEVFIKGIDIVKQGQALISKQLGEEFIREAISPENEREMLEIAEDKIRKFYKTKLDPALFALIARYKPDKKNVPVLSFVARMRELITRIGNDDSANAQHLKALYEPPEAGDKFEYIVVKKEQQYTLKGTKIELKKGDIMEFLRAYKASQSDAQPMEIGLDYYMKGQVIGIFSRFIAYHPRFQPPAGMYDINDKEEYKLMDKYCVAQATKYLEGICDSITGMDRTAINKQGRDYRKAFTKCDKQIRRDISSKYGSMGIIMHDLNISAGPVPHSTQIVNQMKEIAAVYAMKTTELKTGVDYMELNDQREGPSAFILRRIFIGDRVGNISHQRVMLCNRRETTITDKLYQLMGPMSAIVSKYGKNVVSIINDARRLEVGLEKTTVEPPIVVDPATDDVKLLESDLNLLTTFAEHEVATIKAVFELLLELISVNRLKANVLRIVAAIELTKAKIVNAAIEPVFDHRAAARAESVKAEVIPEYDWS